MSVPLDPSPPLPIDDDDSVLLEKLHAEAQKAIAKTTRYEIQKNVKSAPSDPGTWRVLGVQDAVGARDAVRRFLDDDGTVVPGDIVRAIPTRNITQVSLDIETTTKLRLS